MRNTRESIEERSVTSSSWSKNPITGKRIGAYEGYSSRRSLCVPIRDDEYYDERVSSFYSTGIRDGADRKAGRWKTSNRTVLLRYLYVRRKHMLILTGTGSLARRGRARGSAASRRRSWSCVRDPEGGVPALCRCTKRVRRASPQDSSSGRRS